MMCICLLLQAESVVKAIGELIQSLGGLAPISLTIILIAVLCSLPLVGFGFVAWSTGRQLTGAIKEQTAVMQKQHDDDSEHKADLLVALSKNEGEARGINSRLDVVLRNQEDHGKTLAKIDARTARATRPHS